MFCFLFFFLFKWDTLSRMALKDHFCKQAVMSTLKELSCNTIHRTMCLTAPLPVSYELFFRVSSLADQRALSLSYIFFSKAHEKIKMYKCNKNISL